MASSSPLAGPSRTTLPLSSLPAFSPPSRASTPHQAPLLIGKGKAPAREGVRNILVTGGAGFIASWVVRHLVVQHPEYNVVCFDKIEPAASLNNLATLQAFQNYSFYYGDITEAETVVGALQRHNIDTILHFAAQSHVDLSFGNSFAFTHTNVYGTHVMLEAAKAQGVKLFLHVSTDEVYGEAMPEVADLLESSMLAPSNPYSATKAAAEMLCRAYAASFKLPIIIVRSNNVYGPHQYPEKIVPKFTCLLNRGMKLIIHGDGSPTRRYLYAGDAADAFDLVLSRGEIGQIYNVASNDEVSNLELARMLLAAHGQPCDTDESLRQHLDFVHDRPYNDQRYAVDGSKLKALGFRQSTTLEEGLAMTVQWYKQYSERWWADIGPLMTPHPIHVTDAASGKRAVIPNDA